MASDVPHHNVTARPTPPPASSGSPNDDKQEQKPKRGGRRLSEQQLARKRANDREAQRAIRERTRNTIEALEKKVKDLEGGQAYVQMQQLVQEKDELRAENEELRHRLASIVALCDPPLADSDASQKGLPEHTLRVGDGARRPVTSSSTRLASSPAQQDTPGNGTQRVHYDLSNGPRRHSPGSSSTTAPGPMQLDRPHSHDQAAASQGDPPRDKRMRHSRSASSGPSSWNHGGSPANSFTPASVASPSAVAMPGPSKGLPEKAYASLPSHILPTCPFDKILIDFLNDCRKRLAMGGSIDDVIGPAWPDLTTLLYPETESTHRPHSLSNLLCTALRGFSSVQGMPQKVAVCAMAFYIMRWMVAPTPENYDLIPGGLAPTPDQLNIPHPIWIDVVRFPDLRSELVRQYPTMTLESFFYPFTAELSVNWPYSDELSALVERIRRPVTAFDKETGDNEGYTEDIRPTAAFDRHFRDLGNWMAGPIFARAFPWLKSFVRIGTDPRLIPR